MNRAKNKQSCTHSFLKNLSVTVFFIVFLIISNPVSINADDGRWKDDGRGGCFWAPGEGAFPDQCDPNQSVIQPDLAPTPAIPSGRWKDDGRGGCFWAPGEGAFPDQCNPTSTTPTQTPGPTPPPPTGSGQQNISYTINDNIGYYNIQSSGNKVFNWNVNVSHNDPGGMHVVTIGAWDEEAGSAATTKYSFSISASGKVDYKNPPESGSFSFSYDTSSRNCGRVQIDGSFIDERQSFYNDSNLFFAIVIDYGVDCTSAPTPVTVAPTSVPVPTLLSTPAPVISPASTPAPTPTSTPEPTPEPTPTPTPTPNPETTPTPHTGKITFCLVLADQNDVIATTSSALPAGVFSIDLNTATTTGNTIQTKTWVTPTFSPNKKIILNNDFDADCVTYDNLTLGSYYYSELSVNGALWLTPKYNDQNTQTVNSITDFYLYNSNVNSDGQITITVGNADQTLVILEKDNTALSCPLPEITSSLTASGTVGQAFTYTLTASSTTATTFSVGALTAGLSFSTTTNAITGIPTASGTFNVSLNAVNTCVGGIDIRTLVLVISPAPSGDGGGGGGGGSSSGSGGSSRPPRTTPTLECFYLRDYMRRDFNNDSIEVLKLQAFLINFEGHSNVALTGVFDQATFDAVSAFQMKYFDDILAPWGHTAPTGYVYILTLKKINEIYCQRIFPLNQAQINEIVAFRALLENLRQRGINPVLPEGSATTTEPNIPIVGQLGPPKGQNTFVNIAAAILTRPESLPDGLKCLYEFLLLLMAIYIIANVFKNVFYKNTPENNRKRFLVKWFTINVGLIVAIVVALTLEWLCLILPFLVALMLSLIWTISYPEHHSMRASVKSWYLVSLARGKSMLKEIKETPKSSPVPFKEEPIRWNIKKESAPDVIFIEPKNGPKIEPKK